MSPEGNGERNLENDSAIEKKIRAFLKKIAKQFSTHPEVIEDVVREYVRMRPLPPPKEMKEWENTFLQEKKDRIRREIVIDEVSEGCGIAAQAVIDIVLPHLLEEYPFPSSTSQQEEWREFLTEVCFERIDELNTRTQELIEEAENNEE